MIDINTITLKNDHELKVDNEVINYKDYISSEGLEMDFSWDGHKYQIFNRRQDGIDIIDFSSERAASPRNVRILERIPLEGRTQFFHKQKYPLNSVDCLSTRDDGSCLYLIDLQRSDKPVPHVFSDKIIKSYESYDDYGKLFCMSNHDTLFLYDSRSKRLNEMIKITNSIESKFNLIYNTFRDGRMVSLVTMSNILVFDIRNPGECVLKFKHFCDVPPNRHVFAKGIDEEYHQDIIEELLEGHNFDQFENKVNMLLRDTVEMKDKTLKNSLCLYSCRKNSFPIFLSSYEPYDKQDVENKFNYDIIKEINQSLDPNRLFSQLTRSEVSRLFLNIRFILNDYLAQMSAILSN